jgi:type IV pilus assembly protein PilO
MALENISLGKLPQRTQLLVLTVMMGALCYVFHSYYVEPLKAEVDAAAGRVSILRGEVEKGQIAYSRLPEFKKQVALQETRLTELRAVLPEQKETAQIVATTAQLARDSHLHIKSFQPQITIRKGFYEDWPIRLTLEGSYHNLGVFFEKISQFARIINVDNISIKKADKPTRNRTISASCTATTFVFIDAAIETSAPEPVPTGRRPKKTSLQAPGSNTRAEVQP